MQVQVAINGEFRDLPDGATVSGLLEMEKPRRDGIAVEVNREIVPRARHPQHRLREGDVVEIVTFVGGG